MVRDTSKSVSASSKKKDTKTTKTTTRTMKTTTVTTGPTQRAQPVAFTGAKLAVGLFLLALDILIGAAIIHELERRRDGGIRNYGHALYFAIMTAATVGYSGLTIIRDDTRVFMVFYTILSVALVLYNMALIGDFFIARAQSTIKNLFKLGEKEEGIAGLINRHLTLIVAFVSWVLLVLIIAGIVLRGENNINNRNPRKWNYGLAVYWAVMTFTTVGPNDVYPISGLGRVFAAIGIGLAFLIYAALLAQLALSIVRKTERLYHTQGRIEVAVARVREIVDGFDGDQPKLVDAIIEELRPQTVSESATEFTYVYTYEDSESASASESESESV